MKNSIGSGFEKAFSPFEYRTRVRELFQKQRFSVVNLIHAIQIDKQKAFLGKACAAHEDNCLRQLIKIPSDHIKIIPGCIVCIGEFNYNYFSFRITA